VILDKIEIRPLQSSYARFHSVRAAFKPAPTPFQKDGAGFQHPMASTPETKCIGAPEENYITDEVISR
jgi:hypothetical protein